MITKMKNIAVLGRALFAFVFLCFFPLHSSLADSFIILNDSGRAFETRLAMVREAKQEIDTEYFQVEDDRLAAMYFSELERAASARQNGSRRSSETAHRRT
jgi:phosphatidylserine/phosphatidylglycerophosphate/cardiolipin synthase-like enzyme